MLTKVSKSIENLFFPVVRCAICKDKTTLEYRGLCRHCLEALKSLVDGYELCDFCGNFYDKNFNSCPRCFVKKLPRSYIKAIACYPYEKEAKELILALKFHNGRYLAEPMAKLMIECHGDIGENEKYSYLVPVPLSPQRLREREYNQAEILAWELSYLTDIPLRKNALVKIKDTLSQTDFTGEQRRKNTEGAFALGADKDIAGKYIILIDDVITTGSTVHQCARILKRGGAKGVKVLTFCGTGKMKT